MLALVLLLLECCFLYKAQVLPYLIDCYSLLSYNLQGYIVVQYLNQFFFTESNN